MLDRQNLSEGSKNQIGERTEVYYLGGTSGPFEMAHSSIFEKTGRTEMGLRCLRCSPTKQDVLGLIPGRAYFSFSFLFFSFLLLHLYIVVICFVF